jgi:Mg2+/Co2+ transporter CorB
LKLELAFLPPYSPALAPIELVFGFIKSKIRASAKEEAVNFSKSTGIRYIQNALQELTAHVIKKVWLRMVKTAKEVIVGENMGEEEVSQD